MSNMKYDIPRVQPEFSVFTPLKEKNRVAVPYKRNRAPVKKKRSSDTTGEPLPYEISADCLIGMGDEGKVYRVLHDLRGLIAVKVIPCDNEKSVKRKFREYFYASQLSMEGLVKYYDYAFVDHELYFEMELCGMSLKDILFNYRMLSEDYEKVFLELLLALEYVHAQGMVHLDVKPSNILITGSGKDITCKLADFGLMVMVGERIQDGGSGMYMAPECLSDSFQVSTSVDVFSLGALMMEVMLDVDLTGWDKNLTVIPWERFDDEYLPLMRDMLSHEPSLRPTCLEILTSVPKMTVLAETYGKVIPQTPSVSSNRITPYKNVKLSDYNIIVPRVSPRLSPMSFPPAPVGYSGRRSNSVPSESPRKRKNPRVSLFSTDSPRKTLFND